MNLDDQPPTGSQTAAVDQLEPDVRAALFAVLARREGEPLPIRFVQSLVAGPEPGSYSFPLRAVPDYQSAVAAIQPELRSHPAAQSLYDNAEWPPDMPSGRAIWPLVARYLEITGEFRADPTAFAQVWRELVAYVLRETVPYTLTMPLLGFSADFEMLPVAEGVAIEKVTPDWRRSRWERLFGAGVSDFTRDGWGEWTHLIRCDAEMPKWLGAAPQQLREVAVRVVEALRLLAPGRVAITQSWLDPLVPVFGMFSSMGLGQPLTWARHGPSMDWTGFGDDVRQVFSALAQASSMPTVALALRRFNAAYDRVSDEDRLIDFWVALEALFLPDRREELSYLGPLRIARYLEQEGSARAAVFEHMRKSYRIRSRIIHGAAPEDVREVVAGAEEVLRRALRKMLLSGVAPTAAAFQNLLLE